MPNLDVTPEALAAARAAAPSEGPITMVNLVRFREQAEYEPGSGHSACSGREAYLERYRTAFGDRGVRIGR